MTFVYIVAAWIALGLGAFLADRLTARSPRPPARFTPADVQAIDQADDDSVALTRDDRWAELEAGFQDDATAYQVTGDLPGRPARKDTSS